MSTHSTLLPHTLPVSDRVALIPTPVPYSDDIDGLREVLRSACAVGLQVALMSPPGKVVADHRPVVEVVDRVPVAQRRNLRELPEALVTSDAATVDEWVDAAVADLTPLCAQGSPVLLSGAIGVGDDAVRVLSRRPHVLAGPVPGFVTLWRLPRVGVIHSAPGSTQPVKVRVPARESDPWTDADVITLPHLGSTRLLDGTSMDGYWVVKRGGTTDIFRVVTAHYGSGHGYARRLDLEKWDDPVAFSRNDCWVYAAGLSGGQWLDTIRRLGKRLDAAGVEQFGALYGRCMRCRQVLTAPSSIARGCGDICAEHLGIDEGIDRQPEAPGADV